MSAFMQMIVKFFPEDNTLWVCMLYGWHHFHASSFSSRIKEKRAQTLECVLQCFSLHWDLYLALGAQMWLHTPAVCICLLILCFATYVKMCKFLEHHFTPNLLKLAIFWPTTPVTGGELALSLQSSQYRRAVCRPRGLTLILFVSLSWHTNWHRTHQFSSISTCFSAGVFSK